MRVNSMVQPSIGAAQHLGCPTIRHDEYLEAIASCSTQCVMARILL